MALGLPTRRLSGAGTAGTRRILVMIGVGGLVLTTAGAVTWYAITREPAPEPSAAGAVPQGNDLPAGAHNSAALEEQRRRREADEAELARLSGASRAGAMSGQDTFDPGVGAPAEAITFPSPDPSAAAPPETPRRPDPDVAQLPNYTAAIDALFAGLAGKPPGVNIYAAQERGPSGAAGQYADGRPGQATSAPLQTAEAVPPAVAHRRKRTLLGGGLGVYGQVKVGGNTDQGSPPIVVEILSGPEALVGARAIGSLGASGQQNGSNPGASVRISSLNLRDGRAIAVNAVLISPDTMETAVASRVDPHTMERIVWPAAARLVAGLGQAIALSGSYASYGAFGGATAYRTFNPAQLAGIAAGAAGQETANILREQAPRSRTVYVDGKADVGVLFLAPVEVDD